MHGAPSGKALVIDANIIIRAALGLRVLPLLETYAEWVTFLSPELAIADARSYVPTILTARGFSADAVARHSSVFFARLPALVIPVAPHVYSRREAEARRRLAGRDESDWPFVALALTFACPIWTEDRDFFGSGVATWTTDHVELYLAENL